MQLLIHKLQVELVHMRASRAIDRAKIVGRGDKGDLGYALFGKRLTLAEMHGVMSAQGHGAQKRALGRRLVIKLIQILVARVDKFGVHGVRLHIDAVPVLPFRAAQMLHRTAGDGFILFAIPKRLVFFEPTACRLIGRQMSRAENGQTKMPRAKDEDERAAAGADIATVPYKIIMQMIKHPLTDSGIEKFLKDWETVPQK